MSLVSVHAVLGFFLNAHRIIVGRSSPKGSCVSAPFDRKMCVANAVRFPALRACSAFGISGADMGAFLLMDVSAFGRWEIFGKRHASVVYQLSAVCSYRERGHTVRVVFYGHGVIGAVSHRISPFEIKAKDASSGGLKLRCMSVRLNPSPRFVELNDTVSRAIVTNC